MPLISAYDILMCNRHEVLREMEIVAERRPISRAVRAARSMGVDRVHPHRCAVDENATSGRAERATRTVAVGDLSTYSAILTSAV